MKSYHETLAERLAELKQLAATGTTWGHWYDLRDGIVTLLDWVRESLRSENAYLVGRRRRLAIEEADAARFRARYGPTTPHRLDAVNVIGDQVARQARIVEFERGIRDELVEALAEWKREQAVELRAAERLAVVLDELKRHERGTG